MPKQIGIILNSPSPASTLWLQVLTPAANAMGVQLTTLDMRFPQDVETALVEALAGHVQAMINFDTPGPPTDARHRIADFALQNRIPLAVGNLQFVQAGALFSYGSAQLGLGHAAASYVAKIANGARARRPARRIAYDLSAECESDNSPGAWHHHPARSGATGDGVGPMKRR